MSIESTKSEELKDEELYREGITLVAECKLFIKEAEQEILDILSKIDN